MPQKSATKLRTSTEAKMAIAQRKRLTTNGSCTRRQKGNILVLNKKIAKGGIMWLGKISSKKRSTPAKLWNQLNGLRIRQNHKQRLANRKYEAPPE